MPIKQIAAAGLVVATTPLLFGVVVLQRLMRQIDKALAPDVPSLPLALDRSFSWERTTINEE